MKIIKSLKLVSGCDMLFSEFKERCSDEKIIYFLKTCGNWKDGTISYRRFVMLSEDRLCSRQPSFFYTERLSFCADIKSSGNRRFF